MSEMTQPNVLVVEDHSFQRAVLASTLRDLGVSSVMEAANGIEGLAAIARSVDDVDLVICDLKMPYMDGVEFLRRVYETGSSPAVVVLSAMEDTIVKSVEDMAEAYGLRVLGSLTKPPQRSAVQAFLRAARERRPSGEPLEVAVSEYDLRAALEVRQFVNHYQPKVASGDGRVVGCEALVRWRRPRGGLIPPNAFIPLAEQTGLIDALTDIVLDNAARHLRRCQDRGLPLHMSVNISAGSLVDVTYPDRVTAILDRHGVKPTDIVFEVTERQVIDKLAQALDCLSRLRLKGFGVAIDDFGTGFASLQQLRRLPATELKIDRDFVHGASADGDRRSILESSVSLGRKLGLSIVAEGVEDQADWDQVAALSCDMVQGYFVSKPLPAEQFIEWSQRRMARCSRE